MRHCFQFRSEINGFSRQIRDGKNVIVVHGKTLPFSGGKDGQSLVMNRMRFSAENVAKTFKGLEGKPAPLGHPEEDGQFISANTPRGRRENYWFADIENVQLETDKDGKQRCSHDVVVWEDAARAIPDGRGAEALDEILAGGEVHTSVSAFLEVKPVEAAEGAEQLGYDSDVLVDEWDHLAILAGRAGPKSKTGSPGASTPEQGTGLNVNSAQGANAPKAVNRMHAFSEKDVQWIDAMEKDMSDSKLKTAAEDQKAEDQVKEDTASDETEAAAGDGESEGAGEAAGFAKRFDDLASKVDGFAKKISDLEAENKALRTAAEARDAEEREQKVKAIVGANLLTEKTAKAAPMEVINECFASLDSKEGGRLESEADPQETETLSFSEINGEAGEKADG